MSPPVTVRNTDTRTRFDGATAALQEISNAGSMIDLGQAMARFGEVLKLPNYLMLHVVGVEAKLRGVCHNVGGVADIEALLQHPMTQGLLARPMPLVFPEAAGGLGLPAITAGVAVAMPTGTTLCALFLGRPGPAIADDVLVETLGLATMAAAHSLDLLKRLAVEACTLTARELECLCYAAAGIDARETALRLNISPRTVEEYIVRARTRLGAESTLAAAVAAIRQGWLTHDAIEALQAEVSPRQSEEYRAGKQ